jgi:hypothetical protein
MHQPPTWSWVWLCDGLNGRILQSVGSDEFVFEDQIDPETVLMWKKFSPLTVSVKRHSLQWICTLVWLTLTNIYV